MLLKEAKDRALWQRIRTAEQYRSFRESMRQFYRETDGDIAILSFRDFMHFSETGNRILFENQYFHRRAQLIAAAGMYLLEQEEVYLNRLQDVMWAICDEYTWSLPAHVPVNQQSDMTRRHIDLFAAETGFALSELSCLLDKQLHPRLLQRVRDEVTVRILNSFAQTAFHWEHLEMNWSAVCAGSVGACFLYLAPDRFPEVKSRILHAMDCFLRGFGTDGCCREGMSYWNYGFGFFTYFADLLYRFTDGQENLFADKRAAQTAQFPQAAFLNASTVISFADCGPDADAQPGLVCYLMRRYPGQISFSGRFSELRDPNDRCYRWATFIRNLVWTDPALLVPKKPQPVQYLPEAQWYINHTGPFSLAAKGGHNDEPHNHNDLGGFILADSRRQLLCDLGSGLYDHAYFQPETRYNVISNSALGHSVPIIDNGLQQPGERHCAAVLQADDTAFSLDITKAYDCDALTQATRTFTLSPDSIRLCDRFAFAGQPRPITERFITRIPPQQDGCNVAIDSLLIRSEIAPAVTELQFTDHLGGQHPFYAIDYTLADADCFCITFQKQHK